MLTHRFRTFVVALLMGSVAAWLVGVRGRVERQSSTLARTSLPQRAVGDFDGDGRTDVAAIQPRSSGTRVSVSLSTAADPVELEDAVIGVVEGDVDADGDLDLVAATASGEVVVWLNDGHGRFTRQQQTRGRGLSAVPALGHGWSQTLVAVNRLTPFVIAPQRDQRGDIVVQARAPAVAQPPRYVLLPTLAARAPPSFVPASI